MDRYLMTHSLLSSWIYAMKDDPYSDATTERDSFAEFMATLRREDTPTTEALQKGIYFENLVTAITEGRGNPSDKWYEAAAKDAGKVRSGLFQCRVKKEIEVSGIPLLLYGRIDILKAGVVYDIKFSGSYEVGNYIDSTQHPVYLELVPEAMEFTYLVTNGSYVWQETYTREETPVIKPIIADFLNYLKLKGLMPVYKEKWLAA